MDLDSETFSITSVDDISESYDANEVVQSEPIKADSVQEKQSRAPASPVWVPSISQGDTEATQPLIVQAQEVIVISSSSESIEESTATTEVFSSLDEASPSDAVEDNSSDDGKDEIEESSEEDTVDAMEGVNSSLESSNDAASLTGYVLFSIPSHPQLDVRVIRELVEASDDEDDSKSRVLIVVPPDNDRIKWNFHPCTLTPSILDAMDFEPTRGVKRTRDMRDAEDANVIEAKPESVEESEEKAESDEESEDDEDQVVSDPKVTPKMEWYGLLAHDRRPRLYQSVPNCFPRRVRSQCTKGRLPDSFTRVKLISIAWKVGVTNPDGFDQTDCNSFNITLAEGYKIYVDGWSAIKKERLINYIWNRLEETDRVHEE